MTDLAELELPPERYRAIVAANERNLRGEVPLWLRRVGGGSIKLRYGISQGDLGESSWFHAVDLADFGGRSVPATTGFLRTVNAILPLTNNSVLLKAPDPYPSDLPGGKLTVAVGNRVVGTGRLPYLFITGVFVVHITGAGAVLQPPATATYNLQVRSTAAAVIGANDLLATLNLTTAANAVDQPTIASPASRQVSIEGTALATVAALFNGDTLYSELANTNAAAFAIDPNILAVFLEYM